MDKFTIIILIANVAIGLLVVIPIIIALNKKDYNARWRIRKITAPIIGLLIIGDICLKFISMRNLGVESFSYKHYISDLLFLIILLYSTIYLYHKTKQENNDNN